MRIILDGRIYDTQTATKIAIFKHRGPIRETLYKTRTGYYFIHKTIGQWAEKILPLTQAQTGEWLNEYNANKKYNKTTYELKANKIKRVRNNASTPARKRKQKEKPAEEEKKFPPAIEEELSK